MIDNVLMNIYLKRPDLVREHETHLDIVGAPIESKPEPEIEHVYQEIVEQVAPKAIEPVVKPLDIYVKNLTFGLSLAITTCKSCKTTYLAIGIKAARATTLCWEA